MQGDLLHIRQMLYLWTTFYSDILFAGNEYEMITLDFCWHYIEMDLFVFCLCVSIAWKHLFLVFRFIACENFDKIGFYYLNITML